MPKNKRRGRVNNLIQPNSRSVSNSNIPTTNEMLVFDFSYRKWLQSTSTKSFTNMLKDDSQFSKHIVQVFSKVIPVVTENWSSIKTNGAVRQFPHCHTISSDKINLVKDVAESIHGKLLDDDGEDEDMRYWQLGVSQSLRMVAIYNHSTNVMYPVFLDYHHQLYPSTKHNQDDIDSYDHCPYSTYT